MKKHLTFLAFLTAFLVFSGSIISKAAGVTADDVIAKAPIEAICKAIEFASSDIDSYGLSGVYFNDLQVTAAIPAYEYRNGDFIQIREYYTIVD